MKATKLAKMVLTQKESTSKDFFEGTLSEDSDETFDLQRVLSNIFDKMNQR